MTASTKPAWVTLHYRGQLRHIRVGAAHSYKPVLILVANVAASST